MHKYVLLRVTAFFCKRDRMQMNPHHSCHWRKLVANTMDSCPDRGLRSAFQWESRPLRKQRPHFCCVFMMSPRHSALNHTHTAQGFCSRTFVVAKGILRALTGRIETSRIRRMSGLPSWRPWLPSGSTLIHFKSTLSPWQSFTGRAGLDTHSGPSFANMALWTLLYYEQHMMLSRPNRKSCS